MFQNASNNFRDEMVHYLSIHVFMPGDLVVKKNDPGDSMYFVSRGSVEILDDTGGAFGVLGEGSYFGETSLMKEQPRNATVRAISFCNIYSLNKENFDKLLKKFPQFKKELELTVEVRESIRMECVHTNYLFKFFIYFLLFKIYPIHTFCATLSLSGDFFPFRF